MNEEKYKETWFVAPRYILDMPGISLGFFKVFETIFQFWNKGRQCFLSNPEIANRTGIKATQVKDAIAYFERHKELERIQIGMKRYLMQPLKVVGIPGLSIVPKEVAAPAATCAIEDQNNCIDVTQVAAVAARGGRPGGQGVAAGAATEIKNLNKEIKKPNNKAIVFSLAEALSQNPHSISIEILEEWNAIRIKKHKSPLTARAWARTNSVLTDLISRGLKLNDVLDRMLSSEWRGVEVSYFKAEIAILNPAASKFPTPEERAANDKKSRERELREQQAKQSYIEISKGGIEKLTKNVDIKALRAKQEAEMKKLNMTPSQYHVHITKGKSN